MATTYRVLGQVAPAAATDTSLYVVPVSRATVCSTLAVCNRGVAATFRIAVRPAGAALDNRHFLVFDAPLNSGESSILTLGMTLATTDVVTIRASTANVSFTLFGAEIVQ